MSTSLKPGELFVYEDDVCKEYLMFLEEKKENRSVCYCFLVTPEKGETEIGTCLKSWFEFSLNKGMIKRRTR